MCKVIERQIKKNGGSIEDIAFDFDSSELIKECLNLICETQREDDLRVENLARDYHEICFDMNYLCASNDLESDF